jgi:putative selenate reductase
MGQPATVVYRRTRAEMPAQDAEVRDLLDEGNRLLELAAPVRYVLDLGAAAEGRLVALECVRNELGPAGADGRRRPVPVPGSEFQIPADAVILAIGQKPRLAFLDGSALAFRRDGSIVTDPDTGRAAEAVYAGGDVARGPAIIIQACADGRRAAEAICRQFGVAFRPPPFHPPHLTPQDVVGVKEARARKRARREPALLAVERRDGFALVEQTLSEADARAEAARCLQCSTLCDKCVEVCPNRANYTILVSPVDLRLPLLSCTGGGLAVAGHTQFQIRQARQIVHVDDFCNECGNCTTFCVHHGRPFADKPRLFLEENGFRGEDDNAFFVRGDTIRRREAGQESELILSDGTWVYTDAHVQVVLTSSFGIESMALRQPFSGTLSLQTAAEMAVILSGLRGSAPYLAAREAH